MVDIDAAMGYVVAHGDEIDRARVGWLRSRRQPGAAALAMAESGQVPGGGWPPLRTSDQPSVDATCFRLGELDDLGALHRPAARRALDWLAVGQRPDGTWEEDRSLAGEAPEWARPGDPEARLYLTACVGFWLSVADRERPRTVSGPGGLLGLSDLPVSPAPLVPSWDPPGGPASRTAGPSAGPSGGFLGMSGPGAGVPGLSGTERSVPPGAAGRGGALLGLSDAPVPISPAAPPIVSYAEVVARAAAAFRAALAPNGRWPSFLMTGWFGAALLFGTGWYYESAQIRAILADRLPDLPTGDLASMVVTLRRVGVPDDDRVVAATRTRLGRMQRADGAWPSADGPAFDVHTTVTAIRAFTDA